MRIAICDDEPAQIAYLRRLVDAWAEARGVWLTVAGFASAEAFLFAYEADKGFDLLLLDIQMGGMDGVSLARELRGQGERLQLAFVTGFPDHMAEGYEVAALHYIMKPVSEAKLFSLLDRARENMTRARRSVLFDAADGVLRIYEEDIFYLEAFVHAVEVHTRQGKHAVRASIGEAQALLSDAFIRCHRSYLVNLQAVKSITKNDVVLDNDTKVPLSRRLYGDVNQAFIRYYRG